ncbi:hypothetical protein VTK73DRAFT_6206 [Phialemonium thermophilum]|uniref:Cysteine-rich transmembrane CYSTM domain-containing protein n=1 Tax=Phialemonium thermophilum TaxID=223376 RepID=A0ABR3XWZ4_9PEZI
MPANEAPQQQQPMEATPDNGVVTQQPTSEPQPDMSLRGGFFEECSCCCFSEECACC